MTSTPIDQRFIDQPAWFYLLFLHEPAIGAGSIIKKVRLAGGWSQETFSEAIGISSRELIRYENGQCQPPHFVMSQILVFQYRLIGTDKFPVQESHLADMYRSGAIGRATIERLIEGLPKLLEEPNAEAGSNPN